MKRKTNGIIVLATARRHEHGERSTKYFFLIQKKENKLKKNIKKLVISGAITTDPYQILSEEKNFYYNLYKTKAVDKEFYQVFSKQFKHSAII